METSTTYGDPHYPLWSPTTESDRRFEAEVAATFFTDVDPVWTSTGYGSDIEYPFPGIDLRSNPWEDFPTPYEDLTRNEEATPESSDQRNVPTWMEDPSEDWVTSLASSPSSPTLPTEPPHHAESSTAGTNLLPMTITGIDIQIRFAQDQNGGDGSDDALMVHIDRDPVTGKPRVTGS
jgi:hypothetical protein